MIVLRPKIELQPGIIALPLTVDTDFEITMLANLITLTPGTLSVDVSEDRKTLFIHYVDVPDPQATIDDINAKADDDFVILFAIDPGKLL